MAYCTIVAEMCPYKVGLAVSGSNRAKVRTEIEPETANRTHLKPANHLNELYAKLVQNGNER